MTEIRLTQNLFLRGMGVVYLFAFLSFYLQIQGLYGNNGLLPARSQLIDTSSKTLSEKIHKKPTLLWFSSYLGLNTEYMMDVLSLLGVFLSFTAFISQKFCTAPVFAGLWTLFCSLYQVGQTFVWTQSDFVLLEAGFIAILIAPIRQSQSSKTTTIDSMTFWLVKWLAFRLTLSSGVLKLQTNCPEWWGLTAIQLHFLTQPLPTPLGWYCYYMPNWVQKLGTVHANVLQMGLPLLFFFPSKSVRVVAFYNELFLQFCIIISGNFNYLTILNVILLLSLLDDEYFTKKESSPSIKDNIRSYAVSSVVYILLLYNIVKYYNIRFVDDEFIDAKIEFTRLQFDQYIHKLVTLSIYTAGVPLLYLSYKALKESYNKEEDQRKRFIQTSITLFYVSAACLIFTVSLSPHLELQPTSNNTLLTPLKRLHSKVEQFHIVHSYGMRMRMHGANGRPEIVLEGAKDLQGPWEEYYFKYKPGDVNSSLPWVAPYQPRLDWQLTYAALGTYQQNLWIVSLAHRILEGEPSVLQLLDTNRIPFTSPPKYIRANLYHYHYSSYSTSSSQTWWSREKVGEYFPEFTKDNSQLVASLKTLKVFETPAELRKDEQQVFILWRFILDCIRQLAYAFDPFLLLVSIFIAGCAIIVTSNHKITLGKTSNND